MTTLILDNQKVLRRFNGHPERGAACYALPKKRVWEIKMSSYAWGYMIGTIMSVPVWLIAWNLYQKTRG